MDFFRFAAWYCMRVRKLKNPKIKPMTASPTPEQNSAAVRVCQMLSSLYQDIHLFRYDDIKKEIYILAGKDDSLEIVIYPNGDWEFIRGT